MKTIRREGGHHPVLLSIMVQDELGENIPQLYFCFGCVM